MKKILTLLTISSFVILAGCASDPASVNANAGITETQNQNENTEVVVANANDNANANSNTNANENTNTVGTALELSEDTIDTEIDTSDWLTYTNEEYGFSFKYPEEWVISDQIDKLSINEQIRLNLNPQNYKPDGTYGDMLYRPYVISVSYNTKPFNYYGTLLVNPDEDEIFIDDIKSKRTSGEVYGGGPSMVIVNIPNVTNTNYIEVILNVENNNYETIFDSLIKSVDWYS